MIALFKTRSGFLQPPGAAHGRRELEMAVVREAITPMRREAPEIHISRSMFDLKPFLSRWGSS